MESLLKPRRISSREFASVISSENTKKVQISRDLEDLGVSDSQKQERIAVAPTERPSDASDMSAAMYTNRESFVQVDSGSTSISSRAEVEGRSRSTSTSNPRSALHNTMRKTSGFFKKKFAKASGKSFLRTSVSDSPLPAVPSVPMKFSSPPVIPRRKSIQQPPDPSNSSQDSKTKSNVPLAPPAEQRRRSISLTSVLPPDVDRPNNMAETDRLRMELSEWSLSVDGVLHSLPSDRNKALPIPFKSLEAGKPIGRSASSTSAHTRSSSRVVLNQRSLSEPPRSVEDIDLDSTLQPEELSDTLNKESEGSNFADDDDTPKIRLVRSPSPPAEQFDEGRSRSASVTDNETSSPVARISCSSPQLSTTPLSPSPPGSVSANSMKFINRPESRQSVVIYPTVSSRQSESSIPAPSLRTSIHFNPNLHPNRAQSVNSVELTGEEDPEEIAMHIWNRNFEFMKRERVTIFLGSLEPLNQKVLKLYMNKFDFKGERLDTAFRRLCTHLYLKGETQQIDRILEKFSERYWETNPDSPYGNSDVVHAITYSLLLLNTDLHVAEGVTRMSARQFVKNTMNTIQLQERDQSMTDSIRKVTSRGSSQSQRSQRPSTAPGNDELPSGSPRKRPSEEKRLQKLPALSSTSKTTYSHDDENIRPDGRASTSIVRSNPMVFRESVSNDAEIEQLLKEMYSSIKSQPIFQSSTASNLGSPDSRSSLSLSPNGQNFTGISRASSRRSQHSFSGSERALNSSNQYKRASFRGFLSTGNSMDSIQRSVTPSSSLFSVSTSTTSSGVFSPTLPQTIGFASNLTNTIIREQKEDDENSGELDDIDDEELALLGPPWAKEGILQRKHYWEAEKKRSKDKSWSQVFVVIQKGKFQMFKFGESSNSTKTERLGGGNWMSNAHSVGDLTLTHALSSAMPPPGYSKDRPHVFVLTLSSGSSYFFQAGTADLVNEWVQTCNYWAARLSKEPLLGGVSNIDYGWNNVLQDEYESLDLNNDTDAESYLSRKSRASFTGSFSFQPGSSKVHLGEWKPPEAPRQASHSSEEAQLEALKKYARVLQDDLRKHNELRKPMMNLYSTRSPLFNKAIANWERKSNYILSEIVKFQVYVDSLSSSMQQRLGRQEEKQLAELLKSADTQNYEVNYNEEVRVSEDDTTRTTIASDDGQGTLRNIQRDMSGMTVRDNLPMPESPPSMTVEKEPKRSTSSSVVASNSGSPRRPSIDTAATGGTENFYEAKDDDQGDTP